MASLQKFLHSFRCSSRLLFSSPPSTPLPIPIPLLFSFNYSSSSSTDDGGKTESLTQEELTQINLLIPRLCSSSNHLPEAIRLIHASLLLHAHPPLSLSSLSLSVLIDRLSAEPDLTHSMSFLNRLKHNPPAQPSLLLPITKMLVSSYFRKGKPRDAMKVFYWMSRPDSPCPPDSGVHAVVVSGCCRNAMVVEALKVVRAMVRSNLAPGVELQALIYRGLLREARIREAQELNKALGIARNGDDEEGLRKVQQVLDQIIANWVQ